jgi:Rrf2 family protein
LNSEVIIAIHSLVYLAHVPEHMASSDYIAVSVSVHPVRVRKVLGLLSKHGYIKTKQGLGGGYELACDPKQVTLGELYRLIPSGSLKPKWPHPNLHCPVGAHIENAMEPIFISAEQHLEQFFANYTIQDILERTQKNAAAQDM